MHNCLGGVRNASQGFPGHHTPEPLWPPATQQPVHSVSIQTNRLLKADRHSLTSRHTAVPQPPRRCGTDEGADTQVCGMEQQAQKQARMNSATWMLRKAPSWCDGARSPCNTWRWNSWPSPCKKKKKRESRQRPCSPLQNELKADHRPNVKPKLCRSQKMTQENT